ncbi:metal transporter [Vibrio sp. HA2012]|uniref:magnesium transporter CorA family protein n=1 Tax=Vibrio sp. HA2012 TaxID=1971595 RepID=UPI000C2BDB68|nr:magnesium transporter CorA family protein [Vibrio sp. HA2012]PJC85473.1 metal transporter [Vibrio sp. HA2012]
MIRTAYFTGDTLLYGGSEHIDTYRQQGGRLWIDIDGELSGQEEDILLQLGCHRLAIQDSQRLRHPPKMEEFEENCFILYRGFSSNQGLLDVNTMSLAFFVNNSLLITKRTMSSVGVNALWEHPKLSQLIVTPALLLSRIMNASAQRYVDVILEAENDISELEDSMLAHPDDQVMHRLILLKSHLRKLLRTFSYHTKLTEQMLDGSSRFINIEENEIKHSFRDVHDKFERIESLCNMYYDLCGDLIEGYISLSSHQLNKTMQVLTVITAIFVPLTFIAGIYGMNFENMPELKFQSGYFIVWMVMLGIGISLLVLFRKKRWL